MKNKPKSRLGSLLSNIFNFRLWIDYDRIRAFYQYLLTMAKGLFVPQQTKPTESFDEALKRLAISEETLTERKKGLYRLSILMTTLSGLVFAYGIYLIFTGSIKAVVLSLVVSMLALVMAWRYHFWYFQIKERKLGCTLKEWYRQGLLGEKA